MIFAIEEGEFPQFFFRHKAFISKKPAEKLISAGKTKNIIQWRNENENKNPSAA